jgi:hypothetical protein
LQKADAARRRDEAPIEIGIDVQMIAGHFASRSSRIARR